MMDGYLRQDGRKGIRNYVAVAYLVECARHIVIEVGRIDGVGDAQVIGFPGCYPNEYAQNMMEKLCTHPNVGAVLLVSPGCESFNRFKLEKVISQSGRPVKSIVIQKSGGTKNSIRLGREWVAAQHAGLARVKRVKMEVSELITSTVCGGSDGTSGITGNPAVGLAFDRLGAQGAACIFEETGELIGCEDIMSARAATPEPGHELQEAVHKAARYYETMGYGSFAAGNAEGGLTTIEEKSMGACAKSGSAQIVGLIKPGDMPLAGGALSDGYGA